MRERKKMKLKMKLKMKGGKENKGITLIALMITIVVLLILAGISIGTLTGDNGIIKEAKTSKQLSEKSQWEEQIDVAIVQEEGENHNTTLDDIIERLIKNNIIEDESKVNRKNGDIETKKPSYLIEGKLDDYLQFMPGQIADKNEEYEKNGKAVIPKGFEIVPGLDDVSEGLVISDNEGDTEEEGKEVAEGNQFVWVPVKNFSEFVRYDFKKDTDANLVTDTAASSKYYEPNPKSTKTEYTTQETLEEVKKMYESVKNNGGFYIGRYEAGTTEEGAGKRGEMVCKKGATVYDYIGWSNSDVMTNEEGGAVELSRNFAGQNKYTNVTSTLCYGVQWDAVMRWISKDESLKGYLTNGAYNNVQKGNYKDNVDTNNPAKTGSNDDYQMKNIYDMAGNVREWTMEAYGDTKYRAFRGGYYDGDANSNPVSTRDYGYQYFTHGNTGFRPALYVR